MNGSIRVGYVVILESDPSLARLTIDSILQQDRAADLIVIAGAGQRPPPLMEAVLEVGRVQYESVAQMGGMAVPRGALCQKAMRTAAPMVDVIVFSSEGVVFRADHAASTIESFSANEELVGALEIVSAHHYLDPTLGPAHILGPGALFSDARWTKGKRRRWWHAKILTECSIAARTASLRGLSFEVHSDRFTWTEFSTLLSRLKGRGRVLVSSTSRAVAACYRPERRSGFDRGYRAYLAIHGLSSDSQAAMSHVALESFRLAMQYAMRAAYSKADRLWCRSFFEGMWKAHGEMRSIRRAAARDIRDLV
jgi:hypothetical protein